MIVGASFPFLYLGVAVVCFGRVATAFVCTYYIGYKAQCTDVIVYKYKALKKPVFCILCIRHKPKNLPYMETTRKWACNKAHKDI